MIARASMLLFAATAAPAADFNGTWIYKIEGRNFLVLTLQGHGGTLARPAKFTMDQDGDVTNISGGPELRKLTHWKAAADQAQFTAGDDRFLMRLVDAERAVLELADAPWMLPPLPFHRAHPGENVALAADWPQPDYPPDITALRRQLQAMVDEDQAVRVATPIVVSRMEEIDRKHLPEVERIYRQYGWPPKSLVGKDAAHNFWLLVQHQDLELQRRMLPAMGRAMQEGEASRGDYALLYDRIRVREGKPQHWGSQATCVKGKPVMDPVDEPAGLEERRREFHMPPVKDYLKLIKQQCAQQP